ncbi:MAG TPA: hypothetical protein VGE47_02125, partial [Burkholderiaceae bacterium]
MSAGGPLFGFCMALAVAQAAAQSFDRMPPPGAAPVLAAPQFTDTQLSNGLRLVVAPRHAQPLVTLRLEIEGGSDRPGLADTGCVMLAQGARRGPGGRDVVDAADIAFAAEMLGGRLLIASNAAACRLTLTVPSAQVDDALELLSDLVRAPTFTAPAFARWRTQRSEALRADLSDPATLAAALARRQLRGDVVPTPQVLARIIPAEVIALWRRQLRPEHASLVMA